MAWGSIKLCGARGAPQRSDGGFDELIAGKKALEKTLDTCLSTGFSNQPAINHQPQHRSNSSLLTLGRSAPNTIFHVLASQILVRLTPKIRRWPGSSVKSADTPAIIFLCFVKGSGNRPITPDMETMQFQRIGR